MLSRTRIGERHGADIAFGVGLLVLLGLLLAALASMVPDEAVHLPVERIEAPDAHDALPPQAVRFRLDLPVAAPGEPAWVLWLPRSAAAQVWLEGPGWQSSRRMFFAPDPGEGVLPGGYRFELPRQWEGPVDLAVHSSGSGAVTAQPLVMRADHSARLEQIMAVVAAATYASLLTLSLLALALHAAARDRVFLTLFASATTAMLMLAAVNGHLYTIPGLRVLAGWERQGVWALLLAFLACSVRLVAQYVGEHRLGPAATRAVEIMFWALIGGIGLCLLGLRMLEPALAYLVPVAWLLAGAGSVVLLVDAGLRRVAMSWSIVGVLVAVLILAVLLEFTSTEQPAGRLLTRYVFQGGLIVFLAVCAVGLVDRIGEYREQRDRDRLARADTERRMLREAARTDLVNALQSKLRQVEQKEVAWTAFRITADHLLPLLPVDMMAVVAQGYHERALLLVEPPGSRESFDADVQARRLMLRRQAGNGIAFQQPVTVDGGVSTEAILPLKVQAPAWGAVILRRAGTDGFAADEMALAGEFCRIAQLHADQMIATIKLRQSAEMDALTGSLNRRSIDQWLVRSFAEADRDGLPLSVLFVDLDRFKTINDRYGHAVGDQCLRAVAATLAGALGEGDIFGRYGGEEFIAILPGSGGAAAREIGERLRAAVERQVIEIEGQVLKLTVSVGVATRRDGERTPAATTERADKALYGAKRAGRNCVQVAPAVFT